MELTNTKLVENKFNRQEKELKFKTSVIMILIFFHLIGIAIFFLVVFFGDWSDDKYKFIILDDKNGFMSYRIIDSKNVSQTQLLDHFFIGNFVISFESRPQNIQQSKKYIQNFANETVSRQHTQNIEKFSGYIFKEIEINNFINDGTPGRLTVNATIKVGSRKETNITNYNITIVYQKNCETKKPTFPNPLCITVNSYTPARLSSQTINN